MQIQMAEAYHSMIPRFVNPISSKPKSPFHNTTHLRFKSHSTTCSSNRDNSQEGKKMPRKARKPRKPLIKLSTGGTTWKGEWSTEYVFTLRELCISNLAQEGEEDAEVFIGLSIHKHAGFGFSVEGRVVTSFSTKCSSCFSPYCREIDVPLKVWVLPSSKTSEFGLPEIGGNDPSVIYVKPGCEADLDSVIQDAIRLTALAKGTCSATCKKSNAIWQCTDQKRTYDQRWSKLVEIRDTLAKQRGH